MKTSNVALSAGKPCFSGFRIAPWTSLVRPVRHLSVLMWSLGGRWRSLVRLRRVHEIYDFIGLCVVGLGNWTGSRE